MVMVTMVVSASQSMTECMSNRMTQSMTMMSMMMMSVMMVVPHTLLRINYLACQRNTQV